MQLLLLAQPHAVALQESACASANSASEMRAFIRGPRNVLPEPYSIGVFTRQTSDPGRSSSTALRTIHLPMMRPSRSPMKAECGELERQVDQRRLDGRAHRLEADGPGEGRPRPGRAARTAKTEGPHAWRATLVWNRDGFPFADKPG